MEKYKGWDILDVMPDGWVIDKTAGSPLTNTVFITNGKSVLNGQKRALLRVATTTKGFCRKPDIIAEPSNPAKSAKEDYDFPAKEVNLLARKRFEELLLREILFDLKVCEIEGWNKKEYIDEIKALLDSIGSKRQD